MSDSAARPAKTRQEVEKELMEVLRARQQEWISASDQDRDLARQRFLDALRAFNALILSGKIPEAEPPKLPQT